MCITCIYESHFEVPFMLVHQAPEGDISAQMKTTFVSLHRSKQKNITHRNIHILWLLGYTITGIHCCYCVTNYSKGLIFISIKNTPGSTHGHPLREGKFTAGNDVSILC